MKHFKDEQEDACTGLMVFSFVKNTLNDLNMVGNKNEK